MMKRVYAFCWHNLLAAPVFAGLLMAGIPGSGKAEPTGADEAAGNGGLTTDAPQHRRRSVMSMRALVKNARAGLAFQQANAKETGVIKLPSGLQYQVLKTGTGAKPKTRDRVDVLYVGRLLDGKVFVQTVSDDKPATLKIGEQVTGLQEVLPMMAVGSKWRITIPPKLGFGGAGLPPDIGPEATLVYELELVGIKPRSPGKKS